MPIVLENYGLSVFVDPACEPVSRTEAKSWLKITSSAEDDIIDALITSARLGAESLTSRSFVNRTLKQTHEDFPPGGELVLRASPVSSITSVTYTDQDGDTQTYDSDYYRLVLDRPRPYIKLKAGAIWPIVQTDNDTAVTVAMVAGYGAAATDVPANVRVALKMIIAYAYENRGDGRPIVRLTQVREVINMALGPVWLMEF